MTAAVKDWYDLLRELDQHPEWREELRRLVLTEELLSLPQAFRQLQDTVEKLAATVDRLGQRVEELAEAQRQTDQRVRELAEAQRRTDERVAALAQRMEELAEAQLRTERRVEELTTALNTLTGQLDQLPGWSLEYRYQRHTPGYLGPLLRRIHTLSPEELAALVEDAEDRGLLDAREATGLIQADVVCTGRLQKNRDQKVWAVVEVSWIIGEEDVKRAAERAASLRKIVSEPVIAVVAGNLISDQTAALASMSKVYVLIGSRVTALEDYPKTLFPPGP